MSYVLLYIGGVLIFSIGGYITFAAWRAYREAHTHQEKIQWAIGQMERAMDQINSPDDSIVLAGLQTLSMLNVPSFRLRALRRLKELTQHPNQVIAKNAEAIITKVTNFQEHK
ncbi:MAG TPA: hypothetical protein VGO68_13135 [Pyrinomonadaceae bacterium]|jgi:hypothetical protein|nr:hypothetical protein [Pyrinomonadaceae bacterium]